MVRQDSLQLWEHNITDGFHSKDKNYGAVVYQSFNFYQGNTITIGTDYKRYGGIAENVKAMNGLGLVFGDTTVWELAGYGYIQQTLFDRLILNAGFRIEHNSVFGNEPVPAGGLVYNIGGSTTFKASVAKGFRSPTIRELYLFTPANEDLKPERMINYEIGIIQKLLNDKTSLELNVYKSNGDNLIRTVLGPSGPRNQNTGSFSNLGVEFPAALLYWRISVSVELYYISMDEPIIAMRNNSLILAARIDGIICQLTFQCSTLMIYIPRLLLQRKKKVIPLSIHAFHI
jgi:iron complex outermembrane receptor protein